MNLAIKIISEENGINFYIPIKSSPTIDLFVQNFLDKTNDKGIIDMGDTSMFLLANNGSHPVSVDLIVKKGDLIFK